MDAFEVVGVDELPHDVDWYVEFAGHEVGVHLAVSVVKREESDPTFVFDFVAFLEVLVWPSNLGCLCNLAKQMLARVERGSILRALTFAIRA